MIAVFKTGGKQYSVKPGQILKVEKLEGKKGDNISFNEVLAVSDISNHTFGNPLIKNASINATILDQIRNKKIIVFKKRRRKNSSSIKGHRQYSTVLKIVSIQQDGKKITATVKKIEDKKVAESQSDTKAKLSKTNVDKTQKVKKTATKKKMPKKTLSKKTTKKNSKRKS